MQRKQDSAAKQAPREDRHAAHSIRSVWKYLLERFPPVLVLMLAVSFAAACMGLFSDRSFDGGWWRALGLLTLLYASLLLRYRVTDEWKDFVHDARNYPGRPVPRGAISTGALVGLGVAGLVGEFGSVALLGGWRGLLFYVPVVVMSVLTAFEYWAKEWLDAHFSTAFVVHQLIYIPMFAWAAVILGAPLDANTWLGVASATALFASAEVVRKFQPRQDTEGAAVPDTYSVVWGRTAALVVVVVLIALAGGLAHLVATGWLSVAVSGGAIALILSNHRSDSWVMTGAGAHVPLLALAMLA